jgi:protein SCO1/2
VVGLLIGGIAAIAVFPELRQAFTRTPGQQAAGKALIGGPFTLTGAGGKRVTDEDFRGRYMLVFFGFTHCPDICPAGLQLISAALAKIGSKADRFVPIFVSVDPQRDTTEIVTNYVKNFDDRIVGLSGTPEEVAAVAKAYRVFYEKVPSDASAQDYNMNHTSIIYVMDPKGEYVTHFTPMNTVDDMAAKLQQLP